MRWFRVDSDNVVKPHTVVLDHGLNCYFAVALDSLISRHNIIALCVTTLVIDLKPSHVSLLKNTRWFRIDHLRNLKFITCGAMISCATSLSGTKIVYFGSTCEQT